MTISNRKRNSFKKSKRPKASATSVKNAEGRQLEKALNKAIKDHDFKTAVLLADRYILLASNQLSYTHLVVIAELYMHATEYKKAYDLLMRAMEMDADSEMAPETLFWVQHNRGAIGEAEKVIKKLLSEGPDDKRAMYMQWDALRANRDSNQQAVLDIFTEIGLPDSKDPRYHELMFCYLMALCQVGRADEAAELLSEIPKETRFQTPNLPMAEAQALQSLGDWQGAIDMYTDVIHRFSNLPEAIWNRSICRLTIGDLLNGWLDYLERWNWEAFPSPRVLIDAEPWTGQKLTGKRIVIWAEQGLGDQLLFLSLILPFARTPEIETMVAVHHKLVPLVATWYPEIKVVPVQIDTTDISDFRGFDYHVPMGSLGRYFLDSEEKVSNRAIRYLASDQNLKHEIKAKMGWADDTLLVGVCWRSSVLHNNRVSNYLNVNLVKSLRANVNGGVQFVCLQYNITQEEREMLMDLGVFIADDDFYNDITSHARHVGICDYVVTAGTLTKQLAGLFDRPTLTWGRCGWTYLGQATYPWYRSIATLKIEAGFSESSLVYQINRWLNIAIDNHDLPEDTGD